MKIAIVGGGVGGMGLALSLNAAGFEDVDIYESSPAIRELGVGINVLPHAVRELDELGLLDELAAAGVLTADFSYYSRLGQRIWSEPLGTAAGYRWPQASIHRGELLGVLHRAVTARLGADRIHTAHHLERFGRVGDRAVWAEFIDHDRGLPSVRPRPTYWWDATGFTQWFGEHCTRMRAFLTGAALRCGAGPHPPILSCPAAPGSISDRQSREWSSIRSGRTTSTGERSSTGWRHARSWTAGDSSAGLDLHRCKRRSH